MSLVVGVAVLEGVALSADSRLCLTASADAVPGPMQAADVLPLSDSVQKLIILHDRYLVGVAGGHEELEPSALLAAIAAHPQMQAARRPRDFFATLTAATRSAATCCYLIGWGDDRGLPRLTTLEWPTGTLTHRNGDPANARDWRPTITPVGFTDVVQRLLREDATQRAVIPLGHLTALDAANLSRYCVQTTIDLHRFQAHGRPVGGPVVTALALRGAPAQWLHPRPLEVREFGSAAR